ncbi:MAG TPA: exodeoxyribonuclease VII small subunit [Propionibacteriaceae bacterium]|nr:exodeoxyribonuclease VII small subunit [Micropruina sp.]HBX82493.1 exodeoxyribonuclease VII small subunit [Propionibacteriaceae bacterium]HBY24636.1 exodeoxyribonuclease VII small subunit [Propionibacteriaceae bacterium]
MTKSATPAAAAKQPSPAVSVKQPDLSYEEAREQLVEIVQKLESGSVSLSASLELWERAEALATVCGDYLEGARARLDAARPTAPTPEA